MDRMIFNGSEIDDAVKGALLSLGSVDATTEECFFCGESFETVLARDGHLARMGLLNPDKSIIVCDDCVIGLVLAAIDGMDAASQRFVTARVIEMTHALRITKRFPEFDDKLALRPSFPDAITDGARASREERIKKDGMNGHIEEIARSIAHLLAEMEQRSS